MHQPPTTTILQPINQQPSYSHVQTNGKVLLICDFTGKILFWNGDSKVLELSAMEYLEKNFYSLDFTMYSRLKLMSKLKMGIFKKDQIIRFEVELVKQSASSMQTMSIEKMVKLPPRTQRRRFWSHLKVLKIAVSSISAHFKKYNELKANHCQVSFYQKPKTPHNNTHTKQFFVSKQNYDKFLMFQIEEDLEYAQQSLVRKLFSLEQIQRKMIDVQMVLQRRMSWDGRVNQKIENVKLNKVSQSSIFKQATNVSKVFIPQQVKLLVCKQSASSQKDNRSFTCLVKKEQKESPQHIKYGQLKIEENEMFKIIEEK